MTKNIEKSKSLLEMAKITLERLNKLDKKEYPSNTLTDYYDILHKLMESFLALKGVKISGINAHKNLIDFVCESLFNPPDKIFLQNLRNYRNQISYEGFNIPKNFIERNESTIEDYINRLIDEIEAEIIKNS